MIYKAGISFSAMFPVSYRLFKLLSRAERRSIFHRLLYLRSTLPSCVGAFLRFFRWRLDKSNSLTSEGFIKQIAAIGTIPNNSSGPSHRNNLIECSLHKFDFIRGAESVCKATGKPEASAIPMSFVPLPRLVFPTFAPFFATVKVPSMKYSSK